MNLIFGTLYGFGWFLFWLVMVGVVGFGVVIAIWVTDIVLRRLRAYCVSRFGEKGE